MLSPIHRHVLNTCVDPPHEKKVVAVEFQPASIDIRRAMSAALDGKFKIWMLKSQPDIKGSKQLQIVMKITWKDKTLEFCDTL